MNWKSIILLSLSLMRCGQGHTILRDRISVIHGAQYYQAFLNDDKNATSPVLSRATSADGISWNSAPLGIVAIARSNPSALYADNYSFPLQVAVMTGGGVPLSGDSVVVPYADPYLFYGDESGGFKFESIGTVSIPSDLPLEEWSPDSVVIKHLHKATFAFVRSPSKDSQIYWCYSTSVGEVGGNWTKWERIGDGSKKVASDPAIAVNTFLNRFEIFVLLEGGTLVHAWQTDEYKLSDWGGIAATTKTFNSTPAVHEMTQNIFNGMLQVFVRATDGFVHHISQTTCDKVQNPWGPCTWDVSFLKLGDRQCPGSSTALNPISVGVTTHGGLEVFVLDDDAHLWYTYQLERGDSWKDWEKLGPLDAKNSYSTIPAIFFDESGWWYALSIGSVDGTLHAYSEPRSIIFDASVTYGSNATAKWSVPVDDASRKDRLNVYQVGVTDGSKYLDFQYVGGKQNPSGDPVYNGQLRFSLFLPDGKYEVRYLTSVLNPPLMNAVFTSSNWPGAPEWEQLYRGFALGFGNMSQDYISCVKDGNLTVQTFELAFKYFKDREVITALHYFAQGLSDFSDAVRVCGESPLSEDLLKFISDLISCTEDDCVSFVIDLAEVLLVLYENEYEIYGDILAADNCFAIEAYEQAGLAIGRVTYACLTLSQ